MGYTIVSPPPPVPILVPLCRLSSISCILKFRQVHLKCSDMTYLPTEEVLVLYKIRKVLTYRQTNLWQPMDQWISSVWKRMMMLQFGQSLTCCALLCHDCTVKLLCFCAMLLVSLILTFPEFFSFWKIYPPFPTFFRFLGGKYNLNVTHKTKPGSLHPLSTLQCDLQVLQYTWSSPGWSKIDSGEKGNLAREKPYLAQIYIFMASKVRKTEETEFLVCDHSQDNKITKDKAAMLDNYYNKKE